ncbi:hypothetical protein BDN71DRAFT_1053934 [Pleurotus eryngii]|uniref:MSP domain-containing protein n=1 Tax=Pleurotus eryngii TaxID=5323 RepID=A0A9P5ZY45_PLEER|nr:hypothetical protein BDN71DRAFT_1053934 [Pleurotus eryngii]
MSLAILPSNSIHFNRPFTKKPRKCLRTLVNNNQYAVAFKAKTNASQLYNIKPNSGIIEVGKTLNVVITKVAVTEEPPLDVPCTDKFLFESAGIKTEENTSPEDTRRILTRDRDYGRRNRSFVPKSGAQILGVRHRRLGDDVDYRQCFDRARSVQNHDQQHQ